MSEKLTTTLLLGNCLNQMAQLADNSVDSIVTDPPYGLSFMGKKWDYDVPSVEIWRECLRVLKPGGHLLAFAGTRTQHRMAVNIEDAGFEIRDMIAWVYGSGFPKSLNIGKAVDKLQGNEREYVETKKKLHISTSNTNEGWKRPSHYNDDGTHKTEMIVTKGATEWEGWGTALKPALEPITVARKPFKGTVAENVLEWGTGGINIDESRIGTDESTMITCGKALIGTFEGQEGKISGSYSGQGRFPGNLIHDGSDEVVRLFPQNAGGAAPASGPTYSGEYQGNAYGVYKGNKNEPSFYNDNGCAARFFYCAKASKADRNEGLEHLPISRPDERTETGMGSFVDKGIQPQQNHHPTVKPTALMEYLVKLVTPPSGTVLDPFMGSGSTGKACVSAGFSFIGIEMEQEYIDIAKARIERQKRKGIQKGLF